MPTCDGGSCTREIPWRVTNTALQMRNQPNVPFSVERIHANLIAELAAARCWNLNPERRPVVFKNLCSDCWRRQAASWGDVGNYLAARAKTVRAAVYFQVMRPDYHINGIINKQAIVSCAVHELMHYWSFEGTGIQEYNRRANVDWDEAVADILGFRVYRRTYHGQEGFTNYVTPYGSYSQSLDRARAGFLNVFGRLWRSEADRNRLPPLLRDFISARIAARETQVSTREAAADRLKTILTEHLFTWFFEGPQHLIDNGRTFVDINAFLENGNLMNMFSITNAFQAYDGNNSLHPI